MKSYMNSIEDKANYLKGLIRIAKADRVIDEEEKQYFKIIEDNLSIPKELQESINQGWDTDEKISLKFTSKEVLLFFIQEAIQIAMIDNNYHELEKKEIYKIGNEGDISDEAIAELEKWVKEGIEWRNKGDLIISKYS